MNIDPVKFYTNEHLKEVDTWINRINEARDKAIEHGIQANAVLLSERLAYMAGFIFKEPSMFGTVTYNSEVPPMILGLEASVEKFMPDGVEFIVTHKPKTHLDKIREDAQRDLIERMKNMSLSEITELIYGDRT